MHSWAMREAAEKYKEIGPKQAGKRLVIIDKEKNVIPYK
jgi:hypothetical protein